MKFLLDENFPKAVGSPLQSLGHEVFDIRDTPIVGLGDTDIFEYSQKIQATLLTTDRDFYHTIPHIYPIHYGVIVVALRRPNRKNIIERLICFLQQIDTRHLHSRTFQLRDKAWIAFPSFSKDSPQ